MPSLLPDVYVPTYSKRDWLDHACVRYASVPSKPMPPALRNWRREKLSTITGDSSNRLISSERRFFLVDFGTKSKALTLRQGPASFSVCAPFDYLPRSINT